MFYVCRFTFQKIVAMKNTTVFTSTLPIELMEQLNGCAAKFNIPKNRLIEKSLRLYLEHLKRLEMIHSFQKASREEEILEMAEEGFDDYLQMMEQL